MINFYLKKKIGKEQEFILGEKAIKTLRLSNEARNILLEDFKKLQLVKNPMYNRWQGWLKGEEQHLQITLDQETATNNPKIMFIMPIHPFVKQAAEFFKLKNKVYTKMSVISDILPQSDYYFSIYYWKLYGSREEQYLKVIADSDTIAMNIERLLKDATEDNAIKTLVFSNDEWKKLDGNHYDIWNKAKETHIEKNKRILQFQRESLTRSHGARIALLEERLKNSEDDKITRMWQGAIAKAASDYSRRMQNFEIAEAKADIEFEPIAYGVLQVKGAENV